MLTATLLGCGERAAGPDPDQQAVRRRVATYVHFLLAADGEGARAQLTPELRRRSEERAQAGAGLSCAEAMSLYGEAVKGLMPGRLRGAGEARPDSDLDIAVLVDDAEFEQYLQRGYGRPNPHSAKERGLDKARLNGKIASGEAKLRPLRVELERRLGIEVDVSIIRRGGPCDQGPYIPIQ